MIDKMTKYSFVLMTDEVDAFLTSIQEIGLVDITRSSKAVDDKSSAMYAEAEALYRQIEDIEAEKFARDPEYVQLLASRTEAIKEYDERLPWGKFDKKAIDGLSDLGLKMRFYCVPAKQYNPMWEELYPLHVIDTMAEISFVTVGPIDGYSFPVNECKAPQGTAEEADTLIKSLNASISAKEAALLAEKEDLPALRQEYAKKLEALDKYLADAGKATAAEDKISVIEGFAPTEQETELVGKFDSMGILYMKEDAKEEDNPPIKLRNNKLSKLFESITGMYGMPIYGEFDPTPILSIFFMLFFAMCMGDAGYGIVLLVFGIALNKKWIDFEMFRGLGTLISILGGATFVVGMILGTAFGVNLYEAAWVPDAMKKFMISDSIKIMGYSAQMVLAIGIGVFHICLAMIVKTALYTYRNGFRASVSTWGWTLLIVGGVIAVGLGMLLKMDPAAIKWIVIGIAVISCLGIFVFNTPGRNPLINIGAGLWDAYQVATGLLGDLLSYIRLYALGLAGGLLGGSFNTLGNMVLGDHPTWHWVPFVIILLLGHVLNVLMSSLGAFVHPLRLTFVEYFKNSGYTGEGRYYNPLSKK